MMEQEGYEIMMVDYVATKDKKEKRMKNQKKQSRKKQEWWRITKDDTGYERTREVDRE